MSFLVSTAIAQCQRRLPDVQSAELLTLLNQIHRDILAEIPELRRSTLTVSLVSGTQEYAIGETAFQIDECEYLSASGSTNAVKLLATTVETLDELQPTWRTDAAGTPSQYYLSSNQITANSESIGFYPAPGTTTTSGYPIVNLYGSFLASNDLGLSDSCLVTLHSSQVYVEGVCYLAALEVRPTMAGAYWANYQRELNAAKEYVRTRNEGAKSPYVKNIRSGGYVVPGPKQAGR